MRVVILNYNEVKDISTCTNDFRGKSAIMINLVSDFEVKIYEFNYLVCHKRKTIKHIFFGFRYYQSLKTYLLLHYK